MQLGFLITIGTYTVGNPKELSTHHVLVEGLVVLRGVDAQMWQEWRQGTNARRARRGIGVPAVDQTQIRSERPLHRFLQGQAQNTGHNRFIRHAARNGFCDCVAELLGWSYSMRDRTVVASQSCWTTARLSLSFVHAMSKPQLPAEPVAQYLKRNDSTTREIH